MTLECALHGELVDVALLDGLGVRLYLASLGELSCSSTDSEHLQALEEGVASTVLVDSRVFDLLLVLAEADFEAQRASEVWDGHLKLLHQELNHLVNLLVDDESGIVINRSLLQVDHDEVSTVYDTAEGHLAGWIDPHA